LLTGVCAGTAALPRDEAGDAAVDFVDQKSFRADLLEKEHSVKRFFGRKA
jgi:hypothetical protein